MIAMIQFIKLFNLNFENYLDKFTNPRKNLSDELELATFVYRIEDTYINFAKTHQSAANINIPAFSDVIKELENKIQKLINFTTLSICKKTIKKQDSEFVVISKDLWIACHFLANFKECSFVFVIIQKQIAIQIVERNISTELSKKRRLKSKR